MKLKKRLLGLTALAAIAAYLLLQHVVLQNHLAKMVKQL